MDTEEEELQLEAERHAQSKMMLKEKKAVFERRTREADEKMRQIRQYEKREKKRLQQIRSEREEKEETKTCVPHSEKIERHKRKGKLSK